jgi:hypothetical protein
MNWTSEHQLIGDDEFGSGSGSGEDLLSSGFGDSAENGTKIFGVTNKDNCTGCLNELCITEADYALYRFGQTYDSFLCQLLAARCSLPAAHCQLLAAGF